MWNQKVRKNTPGSNLMWESSRIILPEHKEGLLQQRHRMLNEKVRPELDEQAFEDMGRKISESAKHGTEITVQVFDPYDDIQVTGYVSQIDPVMQRFRFVHGGQRTWIPFVDVIAVRETTYFSLSDFQD